MRTPTTPILVKSTALEFKSGSSDKVYHIWIENVGANYDVKFKYGRRGSTLIPGTKIKSTHSAKAFEVFNKIVDEKIGKGYKCIGGGELVGSAFKKAAKKAGFVGPTDEDVAAAVAAASRLETIEPPEDNNIPMLLNPTLDIDKYIDHDGYVFQEKFDGRRMLLANWQDNEGRKLMAAFNKKGKRIETPSEFAACCKTAFDEFAFILDGEAVGDKFYAFDLLELEGQNQREFRLDERLTNLGMLLRSGKKQTTFIEVATAYTAAEKRSLFNEAKRLGKEGIVTKNRFSPYTGGRPASGGNWLKHPFKASATCIVAKVNDKRSVTLALKNISGFEIVGNVAIPVSHEVPKKDDLVEVQYLYAYRGGSLYQPVYKGPRDDADIDDVASLKFKSE
jgi:bifunctional non-homologous end joining protein LigD